MEHKITDLYENTWAIEDGHVRCFLLAGESSALLVDTGISGMDVRKIAQSLTKLPVRLINTHADPDHISGNSFFEEFYMHPSEAVVYHNLHSGTGKMLPVFDGDIIDLGNRKVEIIHLPGHTPGSITILDQAKRCLIGGDSIQVDGNIFMFGIHRDLEAYILGLEHLLKRKSDFDAVYPSHAQMPVSADVIPELIRGAENIKSGLVKGMPVKVHGTQVLSCDIGICRFLCEWDSRDV